MYTEIQQNMIKYNKTYQKYNKIYLLYTIYNKQTIYTHRLDIESNLQKFEEMINIQNNYLPPRFLWKA